MLTYSGSFSPKSTPGKWSLVTNLSAPLHVSANDGISKQLSSYISVDLVAEQGSPAGKGSSTGEGGHLVCL